MLLAFYVASLLTCALRVSAFTYLAIEIAVELDASFNFSITVDVAGDTCMACVGLIQTFIIMQLAHSLQLIYRRRTQLPPNSLILLATLAGIWIAMIVVYFLAFYYLFYAASLLYLSQSIVLYLALFYLLSVMQQTASTNFSAMSDEREKLGKVVGVFGFAYIIGTLTSCVKAIYLVEFKQLL